MAGIKTLYIHNGNKSIIPTAAINRCLSNGGVIEMTKLANTKGLMVMFSYETENKNPSKLYKIDLKRISFDGAGHSYDFANFSSFGKIAIPDESELELIADFVNEKMSSLNLEKPLKNYFISGPI